jgi:hypothetical protein
MPLLPAALLLAACSGVEGRGAGSLVLDTIGDTIVARSQGAGTWGNQPAEVVREVRIGELEGADEYTFGRIVAVGVGPDGSIYVLDEQVPTVRRYAADGRHIASFGRSGAGPGELKQPDGMTVLRDGRVLVRDPGNARINVYDGDGTSLDTWTIPGGFFTGDPIRVDSAGAVYTPIIAERRADGSWNIGLLRMREGVVQDTLVGPYEGFEPAMLKAERITKEGSSRNFTTVPFTPTASADLSPAGTFVTGISSRYAIDTFRPDGRVFRIERVYAPVAVQGSERAAQVERITRNMRNLDPDWRWSGTQPPDQKPPFKGIRVAADGRIWVQLYAPGERLPDDPDARPDPRGLPPLERWSEPSVYDVFEADGRYVGQVRVADRFTPYVMRAEQVWGVERDELGVEYVARYRITPQEPAD